MLSDYVSLPFSRTIGSVKDHLQFWTDFKHHFASVPSDPLYKALDFAHTCWWRPFPQFGGVLLALSDGGSTVDLIVCVLDAWEHVCQTDATREAQHDSLSRKHTVYCAGSVNEGLLPQLEEILQGDVFTNECVFSDLRRGAISAHPLFTNRGTLINDGTTLNTVTSNTSAAVRRCFFFFFWFSKMVPVNLYITVTQILSVHNKVSLVWMGPQAK